MWHALLLASLAWAIENLNCELVLAPYVVAPGVAVELGRDEVVVRGHLEANRYLSPITQVRFGVRDTHAFDHIFAVPGDSLHYLEAGDRVFLLEPDGRVFLEGYYNERLKMVTVDWTGEDREVRLPEPRLYQDRATTAPRLVPDRFLELFAAGHPVVVIKRIDDEARGRMRERLNPQIARYEAHRTDPARFLQIAPGRPPYETRVFETKLEGRLTDGYRNFPQRTKRHTYVIDLRLLGASGPIPIREGDRLFLLDHGGELLTEFEVTAHPVPVRMTAQDERATTLLRALGREARTILIRKAGR